MRAKGLAEAEIMRAKGYTEKDLIDADVQKTYAQNMGTVANGSGGGSLMGDMFGAMANMKVAGTMMEKMDDMLGRASSPAKAPVSVAEKNTWGIETSIDKRNRMSVRGLVSYILLLPEIVFVIYDWWIFLSTRIARKVRFFVSAFCSSNRGASKAQTARNSY